MHPDDHGYTRVCYALGKKARTFSGSVAISETGGIGLGPVRFVVLGDGKVIWRSKVVRELRIVEEFIIDVAQVETLELRVYAQEGNNWSSHAAWLDPYVTTK
jgi:alpha-galactosidase